MPLRGTMAVTSNPPNMPKNQIPNRARPCQAVVTGHNLTLVTGLQ